MLAALELLVTSMVPVLAAVGFSSFVGWRHRRAIAAFEEAMRRRAKACERRVGRLVRVGDETQVQGEAAHTQWCWAGDDPACASAVESKQVEGLALDTGDELYHLLGPVQVEGGSSWGAVDGASSRRRQAVANIALGDQVVVVGRAARAPVEGVLDSEGAVRYRRGGECPVLLPLVGDEVLHLLARPS